VRDRRHDQLPTFGVGRDLSKPPGPVFRQMMGRDLVRPDPERHGALRMTEAARPVLRGEARVTFRKEAPPAARTPIRTLVGEEDAPLLSALKAKRRALAEAAAVPAYVIFPDRTLIEMAEKRPATLDQMAGITGVGAKKLESYGRAFLEVITGAADALHPARMALAGRPEGAFSTGWPRRSCSFSAGRTAPASRCPAPIRRCATLPSAARAPCRNLSRCRAWARRRPNALARPSCRSCGKDREMLCVVSPAKRLDEKPRALPDGVELTDPDFLAETWRLVQAARDRSVQDLRDLMHLSEPLARLNHARFAAFRRRPGPGQAMARCSALPATPTPGLQAETMDPDARRWALGHLRILSGLYGLLRPWDAIQPHRLEMGTRLENPRGADLYAFWGDRVAKALVQQAAAVGRTCW
jgi:hypothetical protein